MTAPITLFEILPDKFKTLPKIKTQLAATRVNLRKTYSLSSTLSILKNRSINKRLGVLFLSFSFQTLGQNSDV